MDKVFEKIARLAAPIKLGVLFGTVALIFGVFFFGIAGGVKARGDETKERTNLQRAKQEYAEAERAKAEEKQDCEKLKKDVKKAKNKMKRFKGVLPDDPEVSLLIKEIKSKLGGLTLVQYERQEEVRKKIYALIPLNLTVVGPFHAVLKFFHEVSVMRRIVNVENVRITEPKIVEGKTQLKVSFRVFTFRYVKSRKGKSASGKKKK